ncbi:hypothetical protein VKT23_009658 [Stygiomarasmius scandens]|uniref:DUF6535 domain-containing protein n=1 Tax=Marasmiellus scandens TaxID=2682957 RepID=A0ABR1JEE2_9AGAR
MMSEGCNFAQNEDHAERAGLTASTPLAVVATASPENDTPASKREDSKPRNDAKIWSLYLKDAEEVARQRAELWKTGLDNLLLFAGLFAGVVASFVIDKRQDLQSDSQQVLLGNIRDVLSQEAAEPFTPSTVSLWINGFWYSSLLITLFSAMMGVLAKAWLVNFIPVTRGQDSQHAYERWICDKRAEPWRDEPDEIAGLSEIWLKLIKSQKSSHVEEAIAEMTRKELSDEWWNKFVEWDVLADLLEHLQEYTTSGMQAQFRPYEVLCGHLNAILGFVDYLEKLQKKPDENSHALTSGLQKSLGQFLGPGKPLHRWNVLPEETRALAFTVRARIDLAHREGLSCNFTKSEVEEQP